MDLLSHSEKFKPGLRGARVVLLAAGAAVLLAGCNATKALTPGESLAHGYIIDPEAVAMVPVGSSREQVLLSLGTPSTTATFDNEVLYYISQQRERSVAFMQPRVTDQQVLAVYLGEDGRVTNIAHYGLQDGKIFDFISRTTPTGGKDQTFVSQLITGVAGRGAPPDLYGTNAGR